jgi:hypothetical protein
MLIVIRSNADSVEKTVLISSAGGALDSHKEIFGRE